MGKLIAITGYVLDTTVYASASPMAIQADHIKFAANASPGQKKSNPAASGSINTVVYANWPSNNEGENHVILIGELQSTLVTNS